MLSSNSTSWQGKNPPKTGVIFLLVSTSIDAKFARCCRVRLTTRQTPLLLGRGGRKILPWRKVGYGTGHCIFIPPSSLKKNGQTPSENSCGKIGPNLIPPPTSPGGWGIWWHSILGCSRTLRWGIWTPFWSTENQKCVTFPEAGRQGMWCFELTDI